MKKVLFTSLILIMSILSSGCGRGENVKTIEGCPNCVFATYKTFKKYGKDGDILKNYTKDYTTLKRNDGRQQEYFLGHVLDDNGKILRAFVCGLIDNKPFCIEGDVDRTKVEDNKEVLKNSYKESDCTETNSKLKCTSTKLSSVVEENGYIDVGTSDNYGYCYILSNYMNCY